MMERYLFQGIEDRICPRTLGPIQEDPGESPIHRRRSMGRLTYLFDPFLHDLRDGER